MAPKHCHTDAWVKTLGGKREGFSFELGTWRWGLATLAVAQVGDPYGAQGLLASITQYLHLQRSTLEEDCWGEGESQQLRVEEDPASSLSVLA